MFIHFPKRTQLSPRTLLAMSPSMYSSDEPRLHTLTHLLTPNHVSLFDNVWHMCSIQKRQHVSFGQENPHHLWRTKHNAKTMPRRVNTWCLICKIERMKDVTKRAGLSFNQMTQYLLCLLAISIVWLWHGCLHARQWRCLQDQIHLTAFCQPQVTALHCFSYRGPVVDTPKEVTLTHVYVQICTVCVYIYTYVYWYIQGELQLFLYIFVCGALKKLTSTRFLLAHVQLNFSILWCSQIWEKCLSFLTRDKGCMIRCHCEERKRRRLLARAGKLSGADLTWLLQRVHGRGGP